MALRQRSRKYFIRGCIFLAAFLIFTIVVRFVNVEPIGPQGTSVGLAKLNGAVFNRLGGFHQGFYTLSRILGIIVLLGGLCVALLAVIQAVHKRSIRKVNWDLKAYILYGIAVLVIYLVTEHFSINWRPVILDEAKGLELSYPSSHTLLSISVIGAITAQMKLRVKDAGTRHILETGAWVLATVTVLARFLAGVHWTTDIIGSILLATALCEGYRAAVKYRYRRF